MMSPVLTARITTALLAAADAERYVFNTTEYLMKKILVITLAILLFGCASNEPK
jgi:hypothetical protein